jgi:hypothetical protein
MNRRVSPKLELGSPNLRDFRTPSSGHEFGHPKVYCHFFFGEERRSFVQPGWKIDGWSNKN